MLSDRYALALVAILAVALVPTAANFYRPLPPIERPIAAGLPEILANTRGEATARTASSMLSRFGATDWVERVYARPDVRVTLTVVRGRDWRPLVNLPERELLPKGWDERVSVPVRVDSPRGPLAAREVRMRWRSEAVLARYVVLRSGEPVDGFAGLLPGLRPGMLLGGGPPFTLVFACAPGTRDPSKLAPALDAVLVPAVEYVVRAEATEG